MSVHVPPFPFITYMATIEALETERRQQVSGLVAEIVMLRSLLEGAGIAVPTTTGAECLSRIRALFLALGYDDPEQHPELMADWWLVKEAVA